MNIFHVETVWVISVLHATVQSGTSKSLKLGLIRSTCQKTSVLVFRNKVCVSFSALQFRLPRKRVDLWCHCLFFLCTQFINRGIGFSGGICWSEVSFAPCPFGNRLSLIQIELTKHSFFSFLQTCSVYRYIRGRICSLCIISEQYIHFQDVCSHKINQFILYRKKRLISLIVLHIG